MLQKIKFWVEENKHKAIVYGIMLALGIGLTFALGSGDVTAAHRR